MSEQQTFGEETVQQHQGWTEMVPANPVKVDDGLDTFGPDLSEIHRASDELSQARDSKQREREGRPVDLERFYEHQGGSKTGERIPERESISAEQAAFDLSNRRELEANADKVSLEQEIAATIDRIRAGDTAEQPQQPQQLDPQQQQQQYEAQSQALAAQWQSMSPEERQGAWVSLSEHDRANLVERVEFVKAHAEAEVTKSLQENPLLLNMVQEEVQRQSAVHQQAAQQYAAATLQNATAAAGALIQAFPELQGLTDPSQIPTAIQVVAKQNPDRARAMVDHIQGAQRLVQEANQARQYQAQQQRQQAAAQFQRDADRADQAFEQWAALQDPPERVNEVRAMARQLLAEDGYSPQQIQQLWNSPYLRGITAQKQLYRAASHELIKRGLRAKAVPPKMPTVQRPGSPEAREPEADHYIRGLENKLNTSMSAKDAAALVVARRARARR